jgi:hypothetical protein
MKDNPLWKWGTRAIAILGFSILLVTWKTGTSFLAELQTLTNFLEEVHRLFTIDEKEPEVNITTIVVREIRRMGTLTTAVYTTETFVEIHQDSEWMKIFKFRTKMLYNARGEVEAGIDLSQLTENDVTTVRNRVTSIQLPPPKILDIEIDLEQSKVVHIDGGLFPMDNKVLLEFQKLAQRTAFEQLASGACQRGLFDEANDSAKSTLTKFLDLAGHKGTKIITTSPNLNCQDLKLPEEL